MEDSKFYQDDLLGLKYLEENGKLVQKTINSTHVDWSDADMKNTFIPFLIS